MILLGETQERMIEIVFLLFSHSISYVGCNLEDRAQDPVLERHMRDTIFVDVWDLKSKVCVRCLVV